MVMKPKWNDLKKHFTDNYVWMLTVTLNEYTLTYHGIICFRDNKRSPEKIDVKVNRKSKTIMSVESEKHGKFGNIQEVIEYTTKRW